MDKKTSILSILLLFQPFYYNFTGFFILHKSVILLGNLKIDLLAHFSSEIKTTSFEVRSENPIILLTVIGVTCMYCRN